MSTVEFHPWNSRRGHVEQPDEWRIDLDPMPKASYADVRRVAHVAQEVLDELGAVGWPKTSGGKGMHVYVRIEPRWGFQDVRRAALAFAREVGRRCDLVDLTWWRKDRDPASIFVDYNQNTRDHTIRCAYSVRGVPEALVSAPLRWDEIDDADPGDFTIATMPARFAELGDLHAGIDDAVFALDELLEWADRDATDGDDGPRGRTAGPRLTAACCRTSQGVAGCEVAGLGIASAASRRRANSAASSGSCQCALRPLGLGSTHTRGRPQRSSCRPTAARGAANAVR